MANQNILNNIFTKNDGLYYTQYEEEVYGCLNIKLANGIYEGDNFTVYFKDGQRHREDGPAYIMQNRSLFYYKNKFIRCSTLEDFQKKIRLLAFI